MKIQEIALPKDKWELLMAPGDKEEAGSELVDLVKNAYSNTPMGSFVNSIKDVIPSDWNVIDWDKDPDIDACVFYRRNRPGESWVGYKIQGVGHDGTRTSKDKALQKVQQLLDREGVWIESSDAMRHILKKLNTPSITDEAFLQKLFRDPDLVMVDGDTYERKLGTGGSVRETVFGKPTLKKQKNLAARNEPKSAINELFTGKKNWEWEFRGSEEVFAAFKVGGVNYRFHASTSSAYPEDWEIEFANNSNTTNRYGITGSGGAAEVFSTVVSIIKELLQLRPDITTLRMLADEPSRQSLYKRMAARLLPDWTVRSGDGGQLTLTKLDSDQK